MGSVPLYPDILKAANWQKHKGIVATVAKGETGIGDALTKLKAKYDNVEWQLFDPLVGGPLPKPRTLADLEQRIKDGKAKRAQLTALNKDVLAVKTKVAALGVKWSKSKVMPKTTLNHVQVKMVAALDALSDGLEKIDDSGYERVRAEIARNKTAAEKSLHTWRHGVNKALLAVERDRTAEAYLEVLHPKVVGLATALSKLPDYAFLYQSDWEAVTKSSFIKGLTEGKAIEDKLNYFSNAMRRLDNAMGIR